MRFLFGLEDAVRIRFAISPMWEVERSLLALRDPATAALHRPWLQSLSGRLGGLDLERAVALVAPVGYTPDFLTPPPAGALGDFTEELARVRATPAALIREEMGIFRRGHRAFKLTEPWLAHPRRELARLAEVLEGYWERAIAPVWPRIRALLEADIAHRARRLTEGGAARVFADLHPGVRWEGDALEVPISWDGTVDLQGRGLLLMPSAFLWDRPMIISREAWQPTLIYPARGIATLWQQEPPAPGGLAGVIGRTRAQLLTSLAAPASTTDLARRLGLTPGGVSQHLTALRAAGLVTSRREGRSVLYVRTPVADQLV